MTDRILDTAEPPDVSDADSSDADLRVGRRVRALRLERGLSLAELAAKSGISIGALSQVERGISSLRVRVLWPLAAALDIEPSQLIVDGPQAAGDLYCVRAENRRSLPAQSEGMAKQLLSPPGSALNAMMVTVEPGGGSAEVYAHPGHEFGFVQRGEVELTVDGARYRLQPGDSFGFRSMLLHGFRNSGSEPCVILWVDTTRPSEVRDRM